MIGNFFRSLDREGVAYLLINGQAAILYGAATFSEDIDLWIEPTDANARRLLAALHGVDATYYKLAPPLQLEHMCRGHGFHFRIPSETEIYLDIMACPPRVPGFRKALARANTMDTSWGMIPTIGIRDLVGLKMTQRLGDYPVIGQLVLRYMEHADPPTAEDYEWATSHVFTVTEMEELLLQFPQAMDASTAPSAIREFGRELRGGGNASPRTRDAVERLLTDRMLDAQRADRNYWQGIIAELRTLRQAGVLVPLGHPVVPPPSAGRIIP